MDLMEIGRRLWESEAAEVAEAAEKPAPRGLGHPPPMAENGGNPPHLSRAGGNPPNIRHTSATDKARGCGKSATSATSATSELRHTPATASEWLDWISERCNVLPEDRTHVAKMLCRLHPRLQQRLAERYVEAWRAAADDEPKYHRRDNAGRRAANMVVTRLLTGRENIQ